jgi:transcriptional regulator with XRE-family HTH domain
MQKTAMPKKKHIGRDIQRIRDFVGLNQSELAQRLGVSQQSVSHYEQSEEMDDAQLDKISKALGVTSEFVRNFKDETAVYNTQHNTFSDTAQNNNPVNQAQVVNFNPLDKYVEAVEEIKKLYADLLKVEREKIELLERMVGKK